MRVRAPHIFRTAVGVSGLLLALGALHGTAWAQTRKVIIDCDPGVDDAIALVMALQHPGFDILGITTTFGNATLEQTTKNALRIVELSGKSVPVYRGADTPLRIPLSDPPDFVHGKDGLGNTAQPDPVGRPQAEPADRFLVDMAAAHPGEITVVAVGRLTNLARALTLDAEFARNVREVVLMGGALYVPGNVSPVGEANISGDPDAADMVFTAPWKVTMVGLDVTTRVRLNDDILERVKARNPTFGPFVWSISRFYAEFHRSQHVVGGFYVHDPSAIVYLIQPDLFETKQGPLRVVRDGIAIGQTIMAAYDYQFDLPPWKGQPLVTAAVGVDADGFQQTIERLLAGDAR